MIGRPQCMHDGIAFFQQAMRAPGVVGSMRQLGSYDERVGGAPTVAELCGWGFILCGATERNTRCVFRSS